MGLLKGNVIDFGDANCRIDIIVYKLFEVSQNDFLNRYIDVFSDFIEWMKIDKKNNLKFIEFLRYTSKNTHEIIFNNADFEIEEDHGVIIDSKLKMVSEVDGIIQFGEAFLCIKGPEFWIADINSFEKRYYLKL